MEMRFFAAGHVLRIPRFHQFRTGPLFRLHPVALSAPPLGLRKLAASSACTSVLPLDGVKVAVPQWGFLIGPQLRVERWCACDARSS